MVDIINATDRMLRDVQRDLADMRDDRVVMMAILNRLDTNDSSFSQELRALRSQFDRFRNETRETLARIEQLLEEKWPLQTGQ